MSNSLAIATATATLQRVLQQAVQSDVDGARVTTSRPDGSGGSLPETGINVYLYHVKRNPAWTNQDTPNYQRRGDMTRRRRAALDLFYVLSFYGNESELEPHRLLGSAVRTLEEQFIFTPALIRETQADPTFSYLRESDLAEQVDMVRSEFVSVSTDELSKIWSVFFQTPYNLSVVYKVTVILIDSSIAARTALPVRDRAIGSTPMFKQPSLEHAIAMEGRYQPIFSNSTLLLRGKSLAHPGVRVRLQDTEVAPQVISDEILHLALTTFSSGVLRAGILALQVVHLQRPTTRGQNGARRPPLDAEATTQTIESLARIRSNSVPVVLRPRLLDLQFNREEGLDDEPRSGQILVVTDVTLGQDQRLVLLLNERESNNPNAYVFDGPALSEDTNTVAIAIHHVIPGRYLVRLQVDGAESMLEIDSDPTSPTYEQYIQPLLQIE
jgi:hypothetical protein